MTSQLAKANRWTPQDIALTTSHDTSPPHSWQRTRTRDSRNCWISKTECTAFQVEFGPRGVCPGAFRCNKYVCVCVCSSKTKMVHENMPISQLSNSGVLRLVAAISFYSDSDSLITWHLDLKALHLDGGIALAVLPPHSWKHLPLLHCCNATRWRFLLGSNLCLATHLGLAPVVDSANKNFTFIANFVGRSGSWWCSLWKQNMLQSNVFVLSTGEILLVF